MRSTLSNPCTVCKDMLKNIFIYSCKTCKQTHTRHTISIMAQSAALSSHCICYSHILNHICALFVLFNTGLLQQIWGFYRLIQKVDFTDNKHSPGWHTAQSIHTADNVNGMRLVIKGVSHLTDVFGCISTLFNTNLDRTRLAFLL